MYNQGMRVIRESGGCRVKVFEDHMQRAPVFRFTSLAEAERFTRWLEDNREIMEKVASKTTSHGKLTDVDIFNLARNVYVSFGFHLVGAITSDEWVGVHEKPGRNRPLEAG